VPLWWCLFFTSAEKDSPQRHRDTEEGSCCHRLLHPKLGRYLFPHDEPLDFAGISSAVRELPVRYDKSALREGDG
jgi:hypothetical protein